MLRHINMKAKVQYNDYVGTTSADRSDFWEQYPERIMSYMVDSFKLPINAEDYQFVGISVSGTHVDDVCAYFFLRNKVTHEIVKCFRSSVALQAVLHLFKRFSFQVGSQLEDVDESVVREIEDEVKD